MGRSSRFDVGFQVHAVELARVSQRPRCQIAAELGLSDTTLAKWVAKSEKDKAPESLGLGEKAELDLLRRMSRLLLKWGGDPGVALRQFLECRWWVLQG